jgi:hypothetical protein
VVSTGSFTIYPSPPGGWHVTFIASGKSGVERNDRTPGMVGERAGRSNEGSGAGLDSELLNDT